MEKYHGFDIDINVINALYVAIFLNGLEQFLPILEQSQRFANVVTVHPKTRRLF